MRSDSLENVIGKMCLQIMYSKYMYKEDLALYNLQWLICHKTQRNKLPKSIFKQNSKVNKKFLKVVKIQRIQVDTFSSYV